MKCNKKIITLFNLIAITNCYDKNSKDIWIMSKSGERYYIHLFWNICVRGHLVVGDYYDKGGNW